MTNYTCEWQTADVNVHECRGVPPRNPNVLPDSTKSKIHALMESDQQLYEAAVQEFHSQVTQGESVTGLISLCPNDDNLDTAW